MNEYDAYNLYLAVKQHFNNDGYDYFRYKGNVNTTPEKYKSRNDKYFFQKIVEYYPNKERLVGFYVSNIIKNPKFYIGDFRGNEQEKNYQEWLGKIESLSYIFERDLRKCIEESEKMGIDFRDILRVPSGKITSRFLEMVMKGDVTLETYVIVDGIIGLAQYYDGKVNDPLYPEFQKLVDKYRPFLKLDRDRFARIFKSYLSRSNFNNEVNNGKITKSIKTKS